MMKDFELFKAWIHAIIDRKVAEAYGQSGFEESVLEEALELELIKLLVEKEKK